MINDLKNKRVAILVADGFEQVEMTEPRKALQDAGAKTELVSTAKKKVQGWNHQEKADKFPVDVQLDAAHSENYDALLLPGGVMNPDQLRTNPKAVEFVKSFFHEGKPVAAICHGPWMLVEADVVRGARGNIVALGKDGSPECGRKVGGYGGSNRSWLGDQPETG
jgi:protease I